MLVTLFGIVMLVRLSQPLNASLPMLVTLSGIVMSVRLVQLQNAAKPMLAIDVSELDYDPELLNTPAGTYDLSKGLDGVHPHDPDDLITKITACGPGDQGKKLWEDSLQLFFCAQRDLFSKEDMRINQLSKVMDIELHRCFLARRWLTTIEAITFFHGLVKLVWMRIEGLNYP